MQARRHYTQQACEGGPVWYHNQPACIGCSPVAPESMQPDPFESRLFVCNFIICRLCVIGDRLDTDIAVGVFALRGVYRCAPSCAPPTLSSSCPCFALDHGPLPHPTSDLQPTLGLHHTSNHSWSLPAPTVLHTPSCPPIAAPTLLPALQWANSGGAGSILVLSGEEGCHPGFVL